ncbi:hypothetical protein SMC26_27080 [Actinomadura fulvescens]|uniref:Acyl carrier protein n=1 Tax=Actinomadura fulvescens TaxID=46160 RepID=A0ABN3PHW9_9ACTN
MTTLNGDLAQAETFVAWLFRGMSIEPIREWRLSDRLVEDLGLDSFDLVEISAILADLGTCVERLELGPDSTLHDLFDQYVSATSAVRRPGRE